MYTRVPVAGLSRLFQHTANAASRSQQILDAYGLERSHVFAIPSVSVQTSFDLQLDSRTGLLALLFGSSSEQTRNTLDFVLRAVSLPSAGDLPSDLPADRRTVFAPPWMVTLPQRPRLCQALTLALRSNRWVLQVPGFSGGADLNPEAGAIEEAIRNTDDHEFGVLFFRLSASPPRYLVVRVAGHDHDGIFLLSPFDHVPVIVFDFLTNPAPSIHFRPMYLLFTLLSHWQAAGAPATQRLPGDIPSTFGSIQFGEFARDLWTSYVAALNSTANADPAQRCVYALTQVKAQFAHALPPPGNRAGDNQASPYISSRVALDITGDRLAGRLVCPEYLLVDDARCAFLGKLASSVDQIAAVAEHSEKQAWIAALTSRASRTSAVVTLSYPGPKPENRFLAVVSALWAGRKSCFAFTCQIDSRGLAGITRCKSLADITLDRKHYMGFHNFWHSILVWELAGAGFVDR